LHSLIGSQIPDLRDIHSGIGEAARDYAELRRLGANIEVIDVGGGPGVDDEGSRSQHYCSANDDLAAYAEEMLRPIARICAEHDLPQPTVFSESGRALTAHHAVLIGDTHAVNVALTEDGGYRLADPECGDSVEELLRYVHFDPQQVLDTCVRRWREQGLGEAFVDSFYRELAAGLAGYSDLAS